MQIFLIIELNEDDPLEEAAISAFSDEAQARKLYRMAQNAAEGVAGAQVTLSEITLDRDQL